MRLSLSNARRKSPLTEGTLKSSITNWRERGASQSNALISARLAVVDSTLETHRLSVIIHQIEALQYLEFPFRYGVLICTVSTPGNLAEDFPGVSSEGGTCTPLDLG